MQGRLLAAMAGVAIGATTPGFGLAAAKVHKCVDLVTKAVVISDTECRSGAGPTAVEDAASAESGRQAEIAKEARIADTREDRRLLERYPDEAALRRVRAAQLAEVERKMRPAARRFAELVAERRPLDVERQFYEHKALPPDLKRKIDASDASFLALRDVFRGLQDDVAVIDLNFANLGERLGRLRAGAEAGSMGELAKAASAPAR